MGVWSRMWVAGRRVVDEMGLSTAGEVRGLPVHQAAAVDWLCRAQDTTPDGGVSAGFHLKNGWLPSYPETTGYIACTFLDLAKQLGRTDLAERAWRMINWLLACQLDHGGFSGGFGDPSCGPIVFNTGQVLVGLVRAAETDPSRGDVRDAARRAADWLTANQDSDGCWRRHTYADIPHVYNSRTAWALLRAGELLELPGLRDAATRNLNWALGRQHSDGWFDDAGFASGAAPFLHTIAYTIRGLLESGALLRCEQLVAGAQAAGRPLAERLVADGWLAGAYDRGWLPAGRYRCLTGEAQMAVIWAKLHRSTGDPLFRCACERAVRFVASTQRLSGNLDVRGAIAGSYPILGKYSRFEFPNWAAKFFVDAISEYGRIPAPAPRSEPTCV